VICVGCGQEEGHTYFEHGSMGPYGPVCMKLLVEEEKRDSQPRMSADDTLPPGTGPEAVTDAAEGP
jgi:hypothetical protein